MSFKLRKWVRNYLLPKLKPDWYIRNISTFTACKKNRVWIIYVEIANRITAEWTNAFMEFDYYGNCIKEDFGERNWKKVEKIDLLLQELGYRYIPETNTTIPAKLEKIKK